MYLKGLGMFHRCTVHSHEQPNVAVSENSDPVFVECKINSSQSYGVLACDGGNGTFKQCEIYSNELAGVGVSGASNPCFTQCTIRDGHENGTYTQLACPLGAFQPRLVSAAQIT